MATSHDDLTPEEEKTEQRLAAKRAAAAAARAKEAAEAELAIFKPMAALVDKAAWNTLLETAKALQAQTFSNGDFASPLQALVIGMETLGPRLTKKVEDLSATPAAPPAI